MSERSSTVCSAGFCHKFIKTLNGILPRSAGVLTEGCVDCREHAVAMAAFLMLPFLPTEARSGSKQACLQLLCMEATGGMSTGRSCPLSQGIGLSIRMRKGYVWVALREQQESLRKLNPRQNACRSWKHYVIRTTWL